MIFGFFGFSNNIRKNPKNFQFLGQKRQKSVKINKNREEIGKNSMQKFPNLSFKTVKKFGPKSSKMRKNRPKNSQFVGQNHQKLGPKSSKGEKIVKKIPNLSSKNVKKVGPKETKIEKIDKKSDIKLFNFFIQKAKKWTKIWKSSTN